MIIAPDGKIREINEIGYRQLGYAREEMLGRHISGFILPEFAAAVDDRMAAVREKGYLVFESAQVRKDGTVLPVEVSSRLIRLDVSQRFPPMDWMSA